MKVGVPREVKDDEYRVAITPAGVREMVEHGHEVLVEAGPPIPPTNPRERRSSRRRPTCSARGR